MRVLIGMFLCLLVGSMIAPTQACEDGDSTENPHDGQRCYSVQEDHTVADPETCLGYYFCSSRTCKWQLMACEEGERYSKEKDGCVPAEGKDCSDNS